MIVNSSGRRTEGCATAYQQAPDGTITVTLLPPLAHGQAYDPAAMQAALDAGQGQRFVSRRP